MRVDRYEVLCREDGSIHRLGHGANSSSYKAIDLDLHTHVVLKVMRQDLVDQEISRRRFLREARAAALLRHPNVAQIFRLGEVDGVCFYAREFVQGETLEAKVGREGPPRPPDALKIALQVAQALVAVKKMNLVHREIKPSNIMMTGDGTIKIIDFGLAKSNPGGDASALGAITLSGFVGTPDYASPEQLNEQDLDVSSDMYSLGVTLWFLLTGRPPFRGAMARVMAQHLQSTPPFEELSGLAPAVVSLTAHLLEKEPARRPATPAHLVEEIESALTALEQGDPAVAPAPLALIRAAQPAELVKMSAAREPVPRRASSRFAFAEMVAGAGIAAVVYFILSRPAPLPQPTSAKPPEALEPAVQEPALSTAMTFSKRNPR